MEIIQSFLQLLVMNSPYVLDGVLLLIIGYLVWERIEIGKVLNRKTEIIDKLHSEYNSNIKDIVDKYYAGNLELVQALNEIKIVLSAMIRK